MPAAARGRVRRIGGFGMVSIRDAGVSHHPVTLGFPMVARSRSTSTVTGRAFRSCSWTESPVLGLPAASWTRARGKRESASWHRTGQASAIRTRRPGRTILDWADDVTAFAAALGLSAFGLVAISGGLPYALARAVRTPRQVTHVAVLSGT